MHYAYNTDTTDTVPDGALVDVTLFDTNRVLYRYDYLQRQSNKIIKEKPGQNESVEDKRTILEERFAYSTDTENNKTTNRVSTKRVFWNNALIHQFQHGYDALGNITNIYDAVTLKRVNYTYDDQGQLLTATHYNNSTKTHTETYTYDNVGNILTFNNGTTSHTYTYGDTQWQDLLTAVDGNEITYDASGNPTEYYNNWTMTWVEGRRLESVTVGSNTYTYQYNADGQRVKKTNPDGSYVEYYVMDGITVGERRYSADKTTFQNIRYTLDENNSVIGISVSTGSGWDNYYFAKNLQGDVLEVYNVSTNEVVAQYTYDSWGNILTATGSMKDLNPFRYRGYYYDGETGFYYLQSRYYDAGIGRFINADDTAYLGLDTTVLSYNLFAYCKNNNVIGYDPTGHFCLIGALILTGAIVGGCLGGYSAATTGGNVVEGAIEGFFTGGLGTACALLIPSPAVSVGLSMLGSAAIDVATQSATQYIENKSVDLSCIDGGRVIKTACQAGLCTAIPAFGSGAGNAADAFGTALIWAEASVLIVSVDIIVANAISPEQSSSRNAPKNINKVSNSQREIPLR